MAETQTVIEELAGPARDAAVGALLEAIAGELGRGAELTPEPELRDASGAVTRSGPLSLPRRADFLVIRNGRRLFRQIEGAPAGEGEDGGDTPDRDRAGDPVALATEDGFVAEMAPFRWDAAQMTVYARQDQPDWAPLRRWFLEWFQTRHSEVAPELFGAVHSLDGPRRNGRGWIFTVDFGSAPVTCLADLISAVASTGAARMRLGQG